MTAEATRNPRRRARMVVAAALLGGTALLPLAANWAPPLNAATNAAAAPATDLPGSFADLVERVSPAVVSIVTTQPAPALASQPGLPPGFGPDSPFAPFFRDFGGEAPEEAPEPREGRALGSGFIIDPEGYVVTNNHVVAQATSVQVVLEDGTKLDAEVVGRDDKVDLALLKVEAEQDLPHLEFGDSDNVRVGDWTIAVGNPFGLGGTVTAGIVSARGRDINSGPYDDYLQLDASINRGNSGGPTFDVNGNVIGVNTAIFSPNGGNVGIGFAIPANLAEPIIAEIREEGFVSRGWLGVQIQTVTPEIAESLGLDEEAGALVAKVEPDSPAAAAGLEVGDVILEFADEEVETVRDLTRNVALVDPGEERELTVWRQGERTTLEVELALAPSTDVAEAPVSADPTEVMGLELASLDAQTRSAAGLADDVQGVVVTDVRGEAADTFRPGDVILSVNNAVVASPADVAEQVEAAEAGNKGAVLMLVNRGGSQIFAALDIPQA